MKNREIRGSSDARSDHIDKKMAPKSPDFLRIIAEGKRPASPEENKRPVGEDGKPLAKLQLDRNRENLLGGMDRASTSGGSWEKDLARLDLRRYICDCSNELFGSGVSVMRKAAIASCVLEDVASSLSKTIEKAKKEGVNKEEIRSKIKDYMIKEYNSILPSLIELYSSMGKICEDTTLERLHRSLISGHYAAAYEYLQPGKIVWSIYTHYLKPREYIKKYMEKIPKDIREDTIMIYINVSIGLDTNEKHLHEHLHVRALAFAAEGRYKDALKDCHKVIELELNENHYKHELKSDIFETTSKIYQILGKRDEAKAYLENAVKTCRNLKIKYERCNSDKSLSYEIREETIQETLDEFKKADESSSPECPQRDAPTTSSSEASSPRSAGGSRFPEWGEERGQQTPSEGTSPPMQQAFDMMRWAMEQEMKAKEDKIRQEERQKLQKEFDQQLSEEKQEYEKKLNEEKNKRYKANRQFENAQIERDEAHKKIIRVEEERNQAQTQIKEFKQKNDILLAQLGNLRQKYDQAQTQLENLKRERDQAHEQLKKAEWKRDQVLAREKHIEEREKHIDVKDIESDIMYKSITNAINTINFEKKLKEKIVEVISGESSLDDLRKNMRDLYKNTLEEYEYLKIGMTTEQFVQSFRNIAGDLMETKNSGLYLAFQNKFKAYTDIINKLYNDIDNITLKYGDYEISFIDSVERLYKDTMRNSVERGDHENRAINKEELTKEFIDCVKHKMKYYSITTISQEKIKKIIMEAKNEL